MARSRAFTFTVNNYTANDIDKIMDYNWRYCCFGFEKGNKKATEHIQGYVYLYDAKTVKQLSKKMLPRAFIEISKGTIKENQIYTSKEGSDEWYSFGDPPEQGRATWEKIEDVMEQPESNPHLYNQYSKMYRQLTLGKKKDHERRLEIIPVENKYQCAKKHSTVMFSRVTDVECYDGEEAIIAPCYTHPDEIMDWVNGYPHKVRRGYEIITVDPQYIYLTYDNSSEKAYLIKKYSDIVDNVQAVWEQDEV